MWRRLTKRNVWFSSSSLNTPFSTSRSCNLNRFYSSSIQIKIKDKIHDYVIPHDQYSLTELLDDIKKQNIIMDHDEKQFNIIHGAHPNLTQSLLDKYYKDNIPLQRLFKETEEIIQPFIELSLEESFIQEKPVDFSYSIISQHLAEYCIHQDTLVDVAKSLNPKITDDIISSKSMKGRLISLIYPHLLKFQTNAHSLLSDDNLQILGSNPGLTRFETSQILTPLFIEFFIKSDKTAFNLLQNPKILRNEDKIYSSSRLANLTEPHLWYPLARQMKRKIYLHIGPTNSGKTHFSLNRLKESTSGVYCGPLRLLAQEIYERFQSEDIPVNLLTGQQRQIDDNAKHTSCTVEMAELDKIYHCAVIDEIQMLNDPDRGWAWTKAVLGLPAKELHLCGNETVVDLVKDMAKECGDSLEIKTYKRLSPLKVPQEPLDTIYELERGDCIIAFSRKNVFAIKSQIERELKQKCCVIYGKLPPETRSQQAKLFNENNVDYPFLVATDAIGMGLNLNIRRVIFSTTKKFDGTAERDLSSSELKQIAGRAGRFKSIFPTGYTTSFTDMEQKLIKYAVDTDLKQVPYAGILPTYEQLELFVTSIPEYPNEKSFSDILEDFSDLATVDNNFFLCGFSSMLDIAKTIDDVDLPLKARYIFCLAPCATGNQFVNYHLLCFAREYSRILSIDSFKDVLPGNYNNNDDEFDFTTIMVPFDKKSIESCSNLEQIENFYMVLDLYVWLSWRFEEFSDRELAVELQSICNKKIELALSQKQHTKVLRQKKQKKQKYKNKKRNR